MKKFEILESEENTSYIRGRGIPKGCKYCLKGKKAVLFLNGICQKPDHCSWYCPISEERKGKELTFANEIEISTNSELLDEIKRGPEEIETAPSYQDKMRLDEIKANDIAMVEEVLLARHYTGRHLEKCFIANFQAPYQPASLLKL